MSYEAGEKAAAAMSIYKPGHSSEEESWQASPHTHLACKAWTSGCGRLAAFAGKSYGDQSYAKAGFYPVPSYLKKGSPITPDSGMTGEPPSHDDRG
eukprot:CAMPEP_0173392336 /NCGR_PEP_ID=MMETSP1356-20130122/19185_1 /TAXON_ID=77927 ORGANISM="Hemiselmis virescens, Strain PCC157" /NCGR_SAMPLE_ID=MMETSP1356 /ASSEMBLY_ACC=CAM_ASM_000847 /LENGTH=95 /DNA_ID=CAMNT_0014350095 /DNA_START=79 /DNA_END=363 /DNA_ORIENTATION=-